MSGDSCQCALLAIIMFCSALGRCPVPLAPASYSLSEGEVPLSPGDARWYALYAAKVTMDIEESCDGESTLDAFLDLKNSPKLPLEDESASFMSDHLSEENVRVGVAIMN